MVPPEADKLLSFDCCWPPEMAVNSCLILLLQSSLFYFLSLPRSLSSLPVLCLRRCCAPCPSPRVLGGGGGWVADGGSFGAKTTMAYTSALTLMYSSMRAHTHPHIHAYFSSWGQCVNVCKRTTGSPFTVLCVRERGSEMFVRVCRCVLVLLQQSSSLVEQSDWQTPTCLSLFVSFWTRFLWAPFPLLIHYCTAADLGASVKH